MTNKCIRTAAFATYYFLNFSCVCAKLFISNISFAFYSTVLFGTKMPLNVLFILELNCIEIPSNSGSITSEEPSEDELVILDDLPFVMVDCVDDSKVESVTESECVSDDDQPLAKLQQYYFPKNENFANDPLISNEFSGPNIPNEKETPLKVFLC